MQIVENENCSEFQSEDSNGDYSFIIAAKKSRVVQLRIESNDSDSAFINCDKAELTEIRNMLTKQIDSMK